MTNNQTIINSFNRAGDKIHIHREIHRGNVEVFFEIMKPGKEYLISQENEGSIEVFYFEPNKRYSTKRLLSKDILNILNGELRIVDPYCGVRTLDILKDALNKTIKFLTKIENLKDRDRNQFFRELQDFKSENSHIELRNYPHTDIHDRYIISSDSLILLGHSIKDLGAKESFAIILNKNSNKNIIETVTDNFDRRWDQSNSL